MPIQGNYYIFSPLFYSQELLTNSNQTTIRSSNSTIIDCNINYKLINQNLPSLTEYNNSNNCIYTEMTTSFGSKNQIL